MTPSCVENNSRARQHLEKLVGRLYSDSWLVDSNTILAAAAAFGSNDDAEAVLPAGRACVASRQCPEQRPIRAIPEGSKSDRRLSIRA